MFASFSDLFRARSRGRGRRPAGRAFPPRLEALEDRTVPSVWFANDDAAGLNTGRSWADAFPSLQSALAAAVSGDEIWVAGGTYQPTIAVDRTISFVLKEGVAVYGGFAGTETLRSQRDWAAHPTTLSGDLGTPGDASDNSYHVVTSAGLTRAAVLDGFTVTAGNAHGGLVGGGMYNYSSSPTV